MGEAQFFNAFNSERGPDRELHAGNVHQALCDWWAGGRGHGHPESAHDAVESVVQILTGAANGRPSRAGEPSPSRRREFLAIHRWRWLAANMFLLR